MYPPIHLCMHLGFIENMLDSAPVLGIQRERESILFFVTFSLMGEKSVNRLRFKKRKAVIEGAGVQCSFGACGKAVD